MEGEGRGMEGRGGREQPLRLHGFLCVSISLSVGLHKAPLLTSSCHGDHRAPLSYSSLIEGPEPVPILCKSVQACELVVGGIATGGGGREKENSRARDWPCLAWGSYRSTIPNWEWWPVYVYLYIIACKYVNVLFSLLEYF